MNPLEQYMLKLNQQHGQLKVVWNDCLIKITGADKAKQQAGITKLLNTLAAMQSLLTNDTTPRWLTEMQANAAVLSNNNDFNNAQRRVDIFRTLSKAAVKMESHVFDDSVTDGIQPLVNFDEIVAKHHDQEKINQTYDKAIKAITDALDNGDVDSIRIQSDLRRILATIEEAKQSSFMNQIFQIPNLQIYLKAVAKVSAKKVPVLNFVFDVIDEAQTQLEESRAGAGSEIEQLLNRQSKEIKQLLEYQPLSLEHKEDEKAGDNAESDSDKD